MENSNTVENSNTLTVKEQVDRLRRKNRSIRDIAKALGVTKYTVEKTLKELESDSVRDSLQTLDSDAVSEPRTLPPVAQTAQPEGQKPQQTGDETLLQAALDGDFPQEKRQDTTRTSDKEPKKTFFQGVFPFMMRYTQYLKTLQRDVSQQRIVWLHSINSKHLKQIDEFSLRAQALCKQHGAQYDNLLLSEVLRASESYLKDAAQTAPVQDTFGFKWLKFPANPDLVNLCKSAQLSDFFLETHSSCLPTEQAEAMAKEGD
ncbi:helix-turn-helix domain-containing protein [Pontibacter pamirensis]|uniref:hypothetical protein n=1 Tax=Pontibacter pamirensis TaxID=2562824 RepID=UPI001389615B|nr:hypothetical protein [Pontibacter pamirensis]